MSFLVELSDEGLQTTETIEYSAESEDPNITDNIITGDFYDYSSFQTSESKTRMAGAGTTRRGELGFVLSALVAVICIHGRFEK